ncbi:hypothetical protein TrLO_g13591 [Triparma laevis f. longispina]|uniref:Uncharacterized protein n=1 Tax=Triparma laevis f. longispina TaxID=1714387 RepID=A0A9W7EFF2_9STRA|nr:hypothetical protein TrLO_g13591 [Triparma laevis f. longispina]
MRIQDRVFTLLLLLIFALMQGDCFTIGLTMRSTLSSATRGKTLCTLDSRLWSKKPSTSNPSPSSPLDNKWLSWMTQGTPTAGLAKNGKYIPKGEITYRESSSLGGIPRMSRYTASDWLHNIYTLPSSSVLRQISGPVNFCFWWGFLISAIHRILTRTLIKTGHAIGSLADHIVITKTPHSLLGSALGLLLVFRTNTAYARFWEGRKIWEQVTSLSRDISRMARLYERDIGAAKLERCMGLLAAFPYLLRQRVQPRWLMKKGDFSRQRSRFSKYGEDGEEEEDIEEREGNDGEAVTWVNTGKTPWRLLPSGTLEDCITSQNRPLWVADRLGTEFVSIPDSSTFSSRERLTFISLVGKLSDAIGQCERIVQTPVPLNYARHTIRFLTAWCLTLPFAVCGEFGLATGPVMSVVAWTLFGIYEIGVQIEDPFQRTLKLSVICEGIEKEVVGEQWRARKSAFKGRGEGEEEIDE